LWFPGIIKKKKKKTRTSFGSDWKRFGGRLNRINVDDLSSQCLH